MKPWPGGGLRAPESPSFRADFGFCDRLSGGPIPNRSSSAIRSVRCAGHPDRAPACTCLSLMSSHSSRRPRGSPKRPRERSTELRARCTRCTRRSRYDSWSAWRLTPVRGGGSWWLFVSATWTAGCSPSRGRHLRKRWAPPRPDRCFGSRWGGRRPSSGGQAKRPGVSVRRDRTDSANGSSPRTWTIAGV